MLLIVICCKKVEYLYIYIITTLYLKSKKANFLGRNNYCIFCDQGIKSFKKDNNLRICPICGSDDHERSELFIIKSFYNTLTEKSTQLASLLISLNPRISQKVNDFNEDNSNICFLDYNAMRTLNLAQIIKENYSQKKYRLIVANNLLEKIPDERKLLEQFQKVLEEDGVILANTMIDERLDSSFNLNTLNPHAQKKIFASFENIRKFGNNFPEIMNTYGFYSLHLKADSFPQKVKQFYGLKDNLGQLLLFKKGFNLQNIKIQGSCFTAYKEDLNRVTKKYISLVILYKFFRLLLWPQNLTKRLDLTEEFEASSLYFYYSSFLSVFFMQIGCFFTVSVFQFFPYAVLITAPIGALLIVYAGSIVLFNNSFGTFNKFTKFVAFCFTFLWFGLLLLSTVIWIGIGKWLMEILFLQYQVK